LLRYDVDHESIWYTGAMNENYTLDIKPVGDHLQVTIPELGITVETIGTSRQEAVDAGTRAITDALLARKKRVPRAARSTRQKAS